MHIYELRINDKKNEAKIFWCSSVDEVKKVTSEQIKQGARTICWEEHSIPIEVMAIALPALRQRYKTYNKHPLRTPTKTFKNNSAQAQCIEMKLEEQK